MLRLGRVEQKQPGQAVALTFASLQKRNVHASQAAEGCGAINGNITGQGRSDW